MRDFKTIYNTEKVYPRQSKLTIYKSKLHVPINNSDNRQHKGTLGDVDYIKLSLQRSKTMIKDIILCNNFDLFATFTFKNQRDDIEKCKDRMTNWLKSQQKYHGSFDYLVIPEFHKDGKSLHFHALFKGYPEYNLRPKISKKSNKQLMIKGHKLYRFKSWNVGHSDASYIDDISKTSNYITKYVTKDMPTFRGKKRYFVSQGLIRPTKTHNVNPEPYYDDPNALIFEYDDIRIIKRDNTTP